MIRILTLIGLVAVSAFIAGCARSSITTPTGPTAIALPAGTLPIMGHARVPASAIVAWVNARTPRPTGNYSATVPLETMAQIFVEEGAAEGVTGDIAFVQSIVETGWFRFSGSVPAAYNNFAGIGATDTNPSPAIFADARTGVRAQIQHLRAYADPSATTCTMPPLHNPCVDPRFALVVPKGRAATWNQMGNGNWASAATYSTSILTLYSELQAFTSTR